MQGGAAVHWAEEAASIDVLGMHREPTSAGGASREARVAVVAGRGKEYRVGMVCYRVVTR